MGRIHTLLPSGDESTKRLPSNQGVVIIQIREDTKVGRIHTLLPSGDVSTKRRFSDQVAVIHCRVGECAHR